MNSNVLNIKCQKVIQNNVEFFIGKLKASEFIQLTTVTKRIITGFDENNLPLYNDKVQRATNTSRVNSVRDYLLKDNDACFPSNIIVSLPSILLDKEIVFTNNNYELLIDKNKIDLESEETPLYIQIIDGQHRFKGIVEAIKSLEASNDNNELLVNLKDFEFTISFFIDAEIEFQAMLFSVINRTPQKVTPDLVYDLFGLTKDDSPQKTSLNVTLALNGIKLTENNKPGPFYKRVRLLGRKVKGEDSPLNQGTFVKTIVTLISTSLTQAERERYDPRESFKVGGNKKTIFREFYATDKDNRILNVLLNFFIAVAEVFKDGNNNSLWELNSNTRTNIFQKTVGFQALIAVLVELFPICKEQKNFSIDLFKFYLKQASGITQNKELIYKEHYASGDRTELKEGILSYIDKSLKFK